MKRAPKSSTAKATFGTPGIASVPHQRQGKALPIGYVPGDGDVICGRGKECIDHIGNMRLRTLVEEKLDQYANASNKNEKSLIIMDTINKIRENSPLGGFIKKDLLSGIFFEVGDFVAVSLFKRCLPFLMSTVFAALT
jgi:hypothetical protein